MTSSSDRTPPPLHVVTDDRVLDEPGFIARARGVLAAGGGRLALHLRGPATSSARLFALASSLRGDARRSRSLLLVNDRVDVALAAEVDGAHLRERSLSPRVARGLLSGETWVGLSVHDREGARAAVGQGLDYLVLGTVFASPSHPSGEVIGPDGVTRVRSATDLPVLAIGGITPERVPTLAEAGAAGVAVLSGVWSAPDPIVAVARYLAALDAANEDPADSLREDTR